MTTRSTTTTVTFAHSFTIDGLDGVWPPGAYQVVTDEAQLDTSFPVYLRTATSLILKSGGMTQSWAIAPNALAALLDKDAMAS